MNINVLLEEKTNLEDLIEGWKINSSQKIVSDGKGVYEYLELERFGNGYKVITNGWVGFIFPNIPGIAKLRKIEEDYAIFKVNDKEYVVNIKEKVLSSGYDWVENVNSKNGVVGFVGREGDKQRVVILSKNGEAISKLRDFISVHLNCFDLGDNMIAFRAREENNYMIVLFDGKEEKESMLYDNVSSPLLKNGIAAFIATEKDGNKIIIFDGNEEKESAPYDGAGKLLFVDGVAAFEAVERGKRLAVLFNGEKEVKSEMFDEIKIERLENDVLYFKGRKGAEWIESTISIG
ncbi:MAG: hypothetical protein J7K22_01590 [Nanoarchaeota archaeon]|nr:hypothetical protein [Nanoarchaeota archaeon]